MSSRPCPGFPGGSNRRSLKSSRRLSRRRRTRSVAGPDSSPCLDKDRRRIASPAWSWRVVFAPDRPQGRFSGDPVRSRPDRRPRRRGPGGAWRVRHHAPRHFFALAAPLSLAAKRKSVPLPPESARRTEAVRRPEGNQAERLATGMTGFLACRMPARSGDREARSSSGGAGAADAPQPP